MALPGDMLWSPSGALLRAEEQKGEEEGEEGAKERDLVRTAAARYVYAPTVLRHRCGTALPRTAVQY